MGGDNYAVTGEFHLHPPPASSDIDPIEIAKRRFAELPIEIIPERNDTLPSGSHMSLPHNDLFIGRDVEFRRLATYIKKSRAASINGFGGLGKTQLAVEFAFHYGQYFTGGVSWFDFSDPVDIPAQVATNANTVGSLPIDAIHHIDEQVARVRAEWETGLPRLLIFDNCETEKSLREWMPPSGGCRVLITTRRDQWDPTLGVQIVPLDVLPRPKSIELLSSYHVDLADEDPALGEIADELGDLPLALHLAGSQLRLYLYALPPTEYLKQLRADPLLRHPELLAESLRDSALSPTKHIQDLARTFALSFERLDSDDPVDAISIALLARAAHFAPGIPIPRDLLRATLSSPQNDGSAALRTEDALGRLLALGLLETQESVALRIHRLLVAFVHSVISESIKEQAQKAVEATIAAWCGMLNRRGYPGEYLPIQPHLRAIADIAQNREDQMSAGLAHTLGYQLMIDDDYSSALTYLKRAVAINEKILHRNHPDLAICLNDLGRLLRRQGDYAGAYPFLMRSLAIQERTFPPNRVGLAISLISLGTLLRDQGDLIGARSHIERAVYNAEDALPPDDPELAAALKYYADVLAEDGEYERARQYYERALVIRESAGPLDHPSLATLLNDYALLLREQDDHEGARTHLERSLAIYERVLPSYHPDLAATLNNLGTTLREQGDDVGARTYFERALAIHEVTRPPDDIHLVTILNELGDLCFRLGDYTKARGYFERVLDIHEQALPLENINFAVSLNNVARVLQRQGDDTTARQYLERVLTITEKILPADDPSLAASLINLGRLLQRQGDDIGARLYLDRVRTIDKDGGSSDIRGD